jgi:hypothetical protein
VHTSKGINVIYSDNGSGLSQDAVVAVLAKFEYLTAALDTRLASIVEEV